MLLVSTAPHVRSRLTLPVVMWSVVAALVPAGVWAWYAFGNYVLLVIGVSVAAAMLAEFAVCRLLKKPVSLLDGTAVLTGLLVAYNMPATPAGLLPLHIPIVASLFAILVAKHAFGGLGHNWINPALAGRIFVFFAWLGPMTSNWATPTALGSGQLAADAIASATPLKAAKFLGEPTAHLDLFLGNVPGCIGEVSAAALLLGGLFLLVRRIINWEIPFFYIGGVALLGWVFGAIKPGATDAALFGGDPLFHVLSGGVMLGAIFMATDWVTSPLTFGGRVVFAIGCAVLTVLIRQTAGNVEGVSFAIVLMNIVVPLLDRRFKKRRFGTALQEAQ